MGGDLDARRGVGEHSLAHPHDAGVGSEQAGDHVQRGGLARAVGSENRQHLARGDVELDVEPARGHRGARRATQPSALTAALQPDTRRAPRPSTTTAATATSRIDSATAASASLSRCR